MEDERKRIRDMLLEIHSHLAVAIVQSLETDDQIIMNHVREAKVLARQAWQDLRD